MRQTVERFKLEMVWLALVAVLLLLTPRHVVGQDQSFIPDVNVDECPGDSGGCA